MSKIIDFGEFLEIIKRQGITKAKTTEKFKNIPKGTILYFGIAGRYITTYNYEIGLKNEEFGYKFNYEWESSWKRAYKGLFELVESEEQKEYVFEINDIIVCDGDNEYGITTGKDFIGKVIQSFSKTEIEVEVLKCLDEKNLGDKCVVLSKFFKLKEPQKKLIENKMEIEDLKKVDPKILKLAKEEVEKGRNEKQQKQAEEVLRGLLDKKDEAEKVVKDVGIDLKEIDKQLKVFEGKK